MKIGLFYGTDTGNTEIIAKEIRKKVEKKFGEGSIDVLEIYKKKKEDMDKYTYLLLGMPTWYDGELQGDWEEFIPEMEQVDFSNKKVAFFGLGDQYGYADYFCDALAVFAEIVEKNAGALSGMWPVKGYEHNISKAQRGDKFIGLCIDTDNQDELTDDRLNVWLEQVYKEFSI